MNDRNLPFRVFTGNACTESWAEMSGSARERHCAVCDKRVHNLAQMRSRQIESLVAETKGDLCAVITRRANGSLVTLDGQPRPRFVANVIATASIALASVAASAQSLPENHQQAVLSGTVLVPDGSNPAEGALVELKQDGRTSVSTKTDTEGHFRISAGPGSYQIRIKQNALFGDHIRDVTLHPGDQVLSPIRTHVDPYEDGQQFVTVGELEPLFSYSPSYVIRHPWRYLRYLIRKA